MVSVTTGAIVLSKNKSKCCKMNMYGYDVLFLLFYFYEENDNTDNYFLSRMIIYRFKMFKFISNYLFKKLFFFYYSKSIIDKIGNV